MGKKKDDKIGGAPPYSAAKYKKLKDKAKQQLSKGVLSTTSAAYSWWQQQDWEKIKEEWEALDMWGNYQWPTLAGFIVQRLGPKGSKENRWGWAAVGPRPTAILPWQGYWLLDRWKDHWDTSYNAKKLAENLAVERTNMEVLGETKELWFEELHRLQRLTMQVDETFQGQLFHPDLGIDPVKGPSNENHQRAASYLDYLKEIAVLKTRALESLSKSLGGDKMHVMALMQKVTNVNATGDNAGVNEIMQKALAVTFGKSKDYDMPLPEELEGVFKDAKNVTPAKSPVQ